MMRRAIALAVLLVFLAAGCGRIRRLISPPTATPPVQPAAAAATPAPSPTPGAEDLAQMLGGDDWQPRLAAGLSLPGRDDIPVEQRVDLLLEGLEREAEAPSEGPPPAGAYLGASAMTSIQLTRALSELGADDVPPLREAAAAATGETRQHVLIALAYAGDREVAGEVRELLAGAADPAVRMDAARALGQLGDRDAIPYLEKALQDPYVVTAQDDLGSYTIYPVRTQAAGALDALGVTLRQRADGSFEIGG